MCLSTARGWFSPHVELNNNLIFTDFPLTHSSTLYQGLNNLIRADYHSRHAPFSQTTNSTVTVLMDAYVCSIVVMYCCLKTPPGKRVTLNETRNASAGPGSLSISNPLRWPHNKLQAQQRRATIVLEICEHRKGHLRVDLRRVCLHSGPDLPNPQAILLLMKIIAGCI